jgi:hypothetical protein
MPSKKATLYLIIKKGFNHNQKTLLFSPTAWHKTLSSNTAEISAPLEEAIFNLIA